MVPDYCKEYAGIVGAAGEVLMENPFTFTPSPPDYFPVPGLMPWNVNCTGDFSWIPSLSRVILPAR